MKRIFFILLFGCVWAEISAQTALLQVYESTQKKPLFGAHVFVESSDGKKIYDITNVQGELKNPLVYGTGVIRIAHLGYKSITDTIEAGKSYQWFLTEDPVALNEYVVTTHAIPTRIEESVFKIRVIDQKRIQAQGAMNLRDLLLQELNIRISQDPVLGAGIRMQGIGGENVKIMIDGVPVIGRLDGNIDLSQINLNNIEKIEIIEGPSSVNYGTNALGGVINLITKKTVNHKLEGNLNAFYETVGNYNFDGRLASQWGKNNFQFSGGRYFFDGFTTLDSLKRFMQWKPKEQYFSDLQYNRGMGALNLRYSGNFFHEILENKGVPESPFYVTAIDQYFRTIRTQQNLFLTGFIKNYHHLDITVSYSYFNRRRQTFKKDLVTLDKNLFDENVDVFHTWMSRGIYNYRKKSSLVHFQAGYETTVETAEGERIVNGFQWMGDFAGFASAEFSIAQKLSIKPAFRYGFNTRFTMPVIPSLHVKFSPIKGLDFRASFARGYRAPSLKELFFEFVDANHNVHGNPNLNAENSNNLNAALSYSGEKNSWSYGASITGFYNDIRNQIRTVAVAITSDSNVYRNENITRFQSVGGQLNVQMGYKDFQLAAGFAYTGIINGLNDSASGNNVFKFYPEVQTTASYDFSRWGGRFTLLVKYTGAQPVLYTQYDPEIQGDVIKEGKIDGFTNLDISYLQYFLKKRIQVGMYGKNLLNITNIQQTLGISSGGAHSSGSAFLPTLWGATFGISLRYNFIVH
ncbi:MAG: TonB-dependent receptor [Flavobacteriales bacterium]|nr:TonB-dependent receptor [Flavobacteriales bacterium]